MITDHHQRESLTSELLSHVEPGNLPGHVGSLLGVDEAVVGGTVVPDIFPVCVPSAHSVLVATFTHLAPLSHLANNLVLFLCSNICTLGKSLKGIPLKSWSEVVSSG